MSTPWIPPNKLLPPTLPPHWQPRGLLAPEGPWPACVLFEAGAGYGKSLAMREACDLVARDGFVAWVALDELDQGPQALFHALIAAIGAHVPRFGADLAGLLAGEVDPKRLWQHFFAEIAAYDPPALAIALDDVHHLTASQPDTLKALAPLLERLPAQTRLLMTSRTRLPVPRGRLLAQGALRVCGPDELRFSLAEAQALFTHHPRHTAATPATLEAWRRRVERLGGWPLGVAMSLTSPLGDDAPSEAPDTDDLSAYIAEEVVARQSPEHRQFMLRAALLDACSPEACQDVLEAPDAEATITLLASEHVLSAHTGQRLYRFPPHLADFLRQAAARELPAAERATIHRRAGAFHDAADEPDLAWPHQVAAHAWEAVAAGANRRFPTLMTTGRRDDVRRRIADLPAAAFASEPALRVWRGHMSYQAEQLGEAVTDYEGARAAFHERGDEAGELGAVVRLATAALHQADERRFGQLILQAQALIHAGRPADVADFHLLRALAATQRGDMGLNRECNLAVLALPIAGDIEVAVCQCLAATNLFTHALHRGDLRDARVHIARAHSVASEWSFAAERLYSGFMLAWLQLKGGEPEAAMAFFKELPGFWREILGWQDRAIALMVWAHGAAFREAWREAEDALRESMAVFERAGYTEGRKVPLEHLLWLMIRRGQWRRALEVAGDPDADRGVQDLAIAIPRARTLVALGRATEARETLEAMLPDLAGYDAHLLSARAWLALALARQAEAAPDAARAAFAQAQALITEWDYGFLIQEDPEGWRALQPLAEPPSQATETVLAVVPISAAAPSPSPPAALSDREDAALAGASAAQAVGLRIRALGGFAVERDGIRIDSWSRRRAKLVLAALVLYPRGLRIADLAAMLGATDLTPGALNGFQSDFSVLRRVLEPELARGATSSYVRVDEDRYTLNREAVAWIDLDAFEAGLNGGDKLRDREPDAAAEAYIAALELYHGDLLDDGTAGDLFDAERGQTRRRAVEVALWLAGWHERRDEGLSAQRALERAAGLAPCEEGPCLALMRHHHTRLAKEQLREAYWAHRRALKTLLAAPPSPEIEAAYRQLMAG